MEGRREDRGKGEGDKVTMKGRDGREEGRGGGREKTAWEMN